MQKFSGEGDTPSPDPTLLGAYGASIVAPTALKLNVTNPRKKILVTALDFFSSGRTRACLSGAGKAPLLRDK